MQTDLKGLTPSPDLSERLRSLSLDDLASALIAQHRRLDDLAMERDMAETRGLGQAYVAEVESMRREVEATLHLVRSGLRYVARREAQRSPAS